MNFEELISILGIYITTFIVCLVSIFFHLVSAEAFLLMVSTSSLNFNILLVILISTFAQMISLSVMFLAGRGVLNFSTRKYEKKMNKIKAKWEKWKNASYVFILITAFTGVPPFTIVSIFAGSSSINFRNFFILGFFGRIVRFSIIVFCPQLIKKII